MNNKDIKRGKPSPLNKNSRARDNSDAFDSIFAKQYKSDMQEEAFSKDAQFSLIETLKVANQERLFDSAKTDAKQTVQTTFFKRYKKQLAFGLAAFVLLAGVTFATQGFNFLDQITRNEGLDAENPNMGMNQGGNPQDNADEEAAAEDFDLTSDDGQVPANGQDSPGVNATGEPGAATEETKPADLETSITENFYLPGYAIVSSDGANRVLVAENSNEHTIDYLYLSAPEGTGVFKMDLNYVASVDDNLALEVILHREFILEEMTANGWSTVDGVELDLRDWFHNNNPEIKYDYLWLNDFEVGIQTPANLAFDINQVLTKGNNYRLTFTLQGQTVSLPFTP